MVLQVLTERKTGIFPHIGFIERSSLNEPSKMKNVVARITYYALLCSSLFWNVVEGRSGGAAGCAFRQPAVSGPHTSSPSSGSLAEAGIDILFDSVAVNDDMVLEVGKEIVVTVQRPGNYFKGVLFRIESSSGTVDTTAVLTEDSPDLQVANVCVQSGVSSVDCLDDARTHQN